MKLGRPATRCQGHINALEEFICNNLSACIAEMQQSLEEEYSVVVSLLIVSCALERLHLSRKVALNAARERSKHLCCVFTACVQKLYKAEQVIAINKTACNKRTGERKYS